MEFSGLEVTVEEDEDEEEGGGGGGRELGEEVKEGRGGLEWEWGEVA